MLPIANRYHRYLALQDEPSSSSNTLSPRRAHVTKRLLISIAYSIPVALFVAGLLLLSLLTRNINSTSQEYGCDPNGKVWITKINRPNLWSHTYGLAITMGFGEFTFTRAKALDIAWDLTIGRGAQLLGALLVYYVFRGPVLAMTRTSSVPYQKVMQMQYNTGGSEAFFTYCKDVTGGMRRTRFHFFVALMLAVSTGYVLVVPTLISAMTGYYPIAVPLMMVTNETFTYLEKVFECAYVIQDGPRIGLDSLACIERDTAMADAVGTYVSNYTTYKYTGGFTGNAQPLSAADHSSMLRLPNHDQHRRIPAPYLNISITNFHDPAHIVFYKDRFLSVDWFENNAWCDPLPTFHWGFSLILFFMFLAITFLVGVGVYAVWLGHFWSGEGDRDEAKRVFGNLKTMLAVGDAIRDELGADVVSKLTDEGLKKALQARGVDMRLRERKDGGLEGEMGLRADTWASARSSSSLKKDGDDA